ncbi:MAG: hypothetical protein MMC33_007610 [Icmadophila ericetorum]|nr:hypothetical protein [Icmadophila ericetorum]
MELKGYFKLAKWMDYHPDTAIFRQFRQLQLRNLLFKQARIIELEEELKLAVELERGIDLRRETYDEDGSALTASSREEDGGYQKEKMDEISDMLKEYNEALLLAKQVFAISPASDRELKVLQNWLNHPKGGNGFLRHIEIGTWRDARIGDTISLNQQRFDDDAFSHWLTERVFDWYHERYGYRRQRPVDVESGFSEYSHSRISLLINIVSIAMSLLLILLSIVVLYFTPSPQLRLFIAALFTFLFSLMMALVTSAGRLQLFMASATFASVQVVFITGTTT